VSGVAAEPSLLATLLLGLLQGLTEFLPISSSGHLVLAQTVLDAPTKGIVLEVILHAGTLLAVLVAFRRDLWTMLSDGAIYLRRPRGVTAPEGVQELGRLVLATLPIVVVGVLGRAAIEDVFENPRAAAFCLLVTGLLLLATRFAPARGRRPNAGIALIMGLMQVVSLLPGISRSGATISGGMLAGGEPRATARFSFLMSVPAILGSVVIELPNLLSGWTRGALLTYGAGFALAFLSGLAAISLLLRVVGQGRFFLFGIYCLVLGLVGIILL